MVQEQARVQVLIEQLDSTKASEKSLREIHAREMEAQLRVVQLCQGNYDYIVETIECFIRLLYRPFLYGTESVYSK